MLSLYDSASIKAALDQPLDPKLRELLTTRLAQAAAAGLSDLTHILAIQRFDDEATIEHEIGFNPLVSPLNGVRYGSPDFIPYWSWLQDVGGWFELIHAIGDSGFAYVLLIQKTEGVPRSLLLMCEEYCRCA
jgi:hypothetical protein